MVFPGGSTCPGVLLSHVLHVAPHTEALCLGELPFISLGNHCHDGGVRFYLDINFRLGALPGANSAIKLFLGQCTQGLTVTLMWMTQVKAGQRPIVHDTIGGNISVAGEGNAIREYVHCWRGRENNSNPVISTTIDGGNIMSNQ